MQSSKSECTSKGIHNIPAEPGELGTALPARKAGFLWVISLLSTLRRPFVTSSPRLISANTAAAPPVAVEPEGGDGANAGGGGGGGGGGGPLAPGAGGGL